MYTPLYVSYCIIFIFFSGDGTMRKNPDVWRKWHPASAHNLHGYGLLGSRLVNGFNMRIMDVVKTRKQNFF